MLPARLLHVCRIVGIELLHLVQHRLDLFGRFAERFDVPALLGRVFHFELLDRLKDRRESLAAIRVIHFRAGRGTSARC